MKHTKLTTLSIKSHPQLNEQWLQEVIAEDPSLLGLRDVILKDKERIQSGAGRLDLLLQDADGYGRYEVEIQLGATDESHIIRTIEYWDIERKRYPQYDHTAVIIAEDVTSRFLNVLSLFNGFIPLMAIKVTAIETPDGVGLQFTKILDPVESGDDEKTAVPTNRNYWDTERANPKTMALVDRICELCKVFSPSVELNYNQQYIGFNVDGLACKFAEFRPQVSRLNLLIRAPQLEENDPFINDPLFGLLEYKHRTKERTGYERRFSGEEISANQEALTELLKRAYNSRR